MVKKSLALLICFVIVVGLFSGCGGGAAQKDGKAAISAAASADTQSAETGKPTNIKIFMASPEFTDGMNALSKEYNKAFPNVTVDVEIIQNDFPTVLKAKIASDSLPDVFWSTTGAELKQYSEYSADMTNEPYVKDFTPGVADAVSYNGKVVGLPVSQQSQGPIYNKKLFADAGITTLPATMSQLEEACKKLQAKGITPFSNGFKEWWVYKHIFNAFLNSEKGDKVMMVEDFKAGKTTFKDHQGVSKYFDFIDMAIKYGLPKPLEVDFNAETTAFATGKCAIMTGQGEWAESGVLKITPDIQMGYMPMPVDEDANNTKIISGVTFCWRVNKDSQNLEEVKKMFNWLYTSDTGKNLFPSVFKVIGPVNGLPAPDTQLCKEASSFIEKGQAFPQLQTYSTDGFQQRFGETMQAYIGKSKTREQAITEIEKLWQQLGNPQ